MTWVLMSAVLVLAFIVVPLTRRRRRLFIGSGSTPVPTMSVSKKHAKRKKAALDAATAALR